MRTATSWRNRTVLATLLGSSLACASAAPHIPMRAPNPNGCYLMLFEQPGFESVGDLLNGPGKWPNLEMVRETNYSGWANRIRSLRVGPAAIVTAFTQPEFRGQSAQYPAGTDHANLAPEVSGSIQSIDIACELPSNSNIKQ